MTHSSRWLICRWFTHADGWLSVAMLDILQGRCWFVWGSFSSKETFFSRIWYVSASPGVYPQPLFNREYDETTDFYGYRSSRPTHVIKISTWCLNLYNIIDIPGWDPSDSPLWFRTLRCFEHISTTFNHFDIFQNSFQHITTISTVIIQWSWHISNLVSTINIHQLFQNKPSRWKNAWYVTVRALREKFCKRVSEAKPWWGHPGRAWLITCIDTL